MPSKLTMEALSRSGHYSDFTVEVGDREFKLHRPILAANSGFFRHAFDCYLMNNQPYDREIFSDGHLVDEKIFAYLVEGWYGYQSTGEYRWSPYDTTIKDRFSSVCKYLSCEEPAKIPRDPLFTKVWAARLSTAIVTKSPIIVLGPSKNKQESYPIALHQPMGRKILTELNQYIQYDTQNRLIGLLDEIVVDTFGDGELRLRVNGCRFAAVVRKGEFPRVDLKGVIEEITPRLLQIKEKADLQ